MHTCDHEYLKILSAEPPNISIEQVVEVAKLGYGLSGVIAELGGERDKNYQLITADGIEVVLKFINSEETFAETDLQIKVLDWLEQQEHSMRLPKVIKTLDHQTIYEFSIDGVVIFVRAYTYVSGRTLLGIRGSQELCLSFGAIAAQMVNALAGFDHSALERVLLWDVMHVARLKSLLEKTDLDSLLKAQFSEYLEYFEKNIYPQLMTLPMQVIHGDLSKSNLVVRPEDQSMICGVLDFGDLAKAPRIVELGIAASYAIDDADNIDHALQAVMRGYESMMPLSELEKKLLKDVIIARLAQRIILANWRAAKFPENKEYILRSTPNAMNLLNKLFTKS